MQIAAPARDVAFHTIRTQSLAMVCTFADAKHHLSTLAHTICMRISIHKHCTVPYFLVGLIEDRALLTGHAP